MTSRILMATVATLALTVPAMAQDKPIPADTQQEQAASPSAEPMPTEQAPAAAAESPTPPSGMRFIQVQEEAQFLANDELIGAEVVNAGGEEVGTIADLVMDQEQKLTGVVLSVGGFLGLGEKWVAVPVDQISFPSDDQPAKLLVEVTAEQLEGAPDFITRDIIEAQEAAAAAQRQAMQQQQQLPSPTTSAQ